MGCAAGAFGSENSGFLERARVLIRQAPELNRLTMFLADAKNRRQAPRVEQPHRPDLRSSPQRRL